MSKILIVDDDPQVIMQFRAMLSRIGYDAGFLAKSDLVMSRLQTDIPDLILMDVHMPGTDGLSLLKQIRMSPKFIDLPVIMLSADVDENVFGQCFEAGAFDFLNKPCSEGVLKARIAHALLIKDQFVEINKLLYTVKEQRARIENDLIQIQAAQSQLIQSESLASLGTLVAGVAHEINNPVNSLHLGAHYLNKDLEEFRQYFFDLIGEDNDPQILSGLDKRFQRFNETLQNIIESSARVKTIVGDLRTFSRSKEEERKSFNVIDILKSTLRLVESQFEKWVTFEVDFIEACFVNGLPNQLNQVFMHLMVNACQAIQSRINTEDSNYRGLLKISAARKDDNLVVTIEDNGIGMSEEILNKIFENFFTTKGKNATGLGLSISYGIIEKHAGKIEIESQPNVGTTFRVLLPALTA